MIHVEKVEMCVCIVILKLKQLFAHMGVRAKRGPH